MYYKKKQALVKWSGYLDKFNSWIPFKDVYNIYYMWYYK